jgi:hypothetical protein
MGWLPVPMHRVHCGACKRLPAQHWHQGIRVVLGLGPGTWLEDCTIKAVWQGTCCESLPPHILLPSAIPWTAGTSKDRLCLLTPASTAHEWWRTLAPEDIHPLLHPVTFWGGVPRKIDLVCRTGGQEFENLCFACTGYPKIVDDTDMAGTARRSKKRALQQRACCDDLYVSLQGSDHQVHQAPAKG